jgi:hypothetical protein
LAFDSESASKAEELVSELYSGSETSKKIGAWTRGLKFDSSIAESKSSRLLFHGDAVVIIAHSRNLRILEIIGDGATDAMLRRASEVASCSLQYLEVCPSDALQMIGTAFNLIGTFKNLEVLNIEGYASGHDELVVAPQGLEFIHVAELTLHLLDFDSDSAAAAFLAFLYPLRLPQMVRCHLFLADQLRLAESRGFEAFFDRHPQLQQCTLVAQLKIKVQLLPHIAASAVYLSDPIHPDLISVLPPRMEELVFGLGMQCKAGYAHTLCQRRDYVEQSADTSAMSLSGHGWLCSSINSRRRTTLPAISVGSASQPRSTRALIGTAASSGK